MNRLKRILVIIFSTVMVCSLLSLQVTETSAATTYSITVSVISGNANSNRAEFYTTGAATIESTGLTSGSDPALYNSAGSRIADDEAGNRNWRYSAASGTRYYAGTFSNVAASYTITSTAPITLVRNGGMIYSITVSVAAGSANSNRAEFYTTGAATIESTNSVSGIDPALYNSAGSRIADDEAGNRNWRYSAASGARYYAGTFSNTAASYKITSTAPITLVRNGGTIYSITVSVAAGNANASRAEFYTTGAATIESTSLTSGSDPALYNSSGSRIADDEAGSPHWRYNAASGTRYYAGTYSNVAARYTITSTAPITLVRNGSTVYSITVSITGGNANANRAEFYTTGAATIESTSLTSGSDPALYNSAGSRIADDEAGRPHWRYSAVSGTRYYAGTYSNVAASYTITSTAPITLVRNGSTIYSITVSVAAGNTNSNRAEFYTTGAATIESTNITSGSDPALYDSAGSRIADDQAGNTHWRYSSVYGTRYYAGTYSNVAASYTITSTAPITLVRNGSTTSTAALTTNLSVTSGTPSYVSFKVERATNATFSGKTYTLTYDPNVLTLADLCAFTWDEELTTGAISQAGISITGVSNGTVTFTVTQSIPSGQEWTGIINTFKFTARQSTTTTVTIS